MFDSLNPLYAFSGLAVGAIVGMTGVGGGSLMTPLLVLLFGVHPATAVGTDLLYAGLTKGVGTVVHGRRGRVDWHIVGALALGSVPASILTLANLQRLGLDGSKASAMISAALGGALLLTSASLILRERLLRLMQGRAELEGPRRVALTIGFGALLGFLVSITSVGAGALGVTLLCFLYPRLDTRTIVGSDIAHAVPLTLAAGAGHWLLGSVNWPMLVSLLVGSIPGIVLGGIFAGRVPERVLRGLLACVLVIVGGRLLLV